MSEVGQFPQETYEQFCFMLSLINKVNFSQWENDFYHGINGEFVHLEQEFILSLKILKGSLGGNMEILFRPLGIDYWETYAQFSRLFSKEENNLQIMIKEQLEIILSLDEQFFKQWHEQRLVTVELNKRENDHITRLNETTCLKIITPLMTTDSYVEISSRNLTEELVELLMKYYSREQNK